MHEAIIQEKAKQFIRQLPKEKQIRVIERIHYLENNPYSGYSLKGKLSGLYSSRIDNFRIIYQIKEIELVIFIVKIGYRKNVFKT